MFGINFYHISSIFIALFAIIDVTGAVPIFLGLRDQGKTIEPLKAAVYSFGMLIMFFFIGEGILQLFQVDFSSFAIAGALVILIISIEMVFGVEIFKSGDQDEDNPSATLVPIVFPLIAGPGTFTTLLAMRAQFSTVNILIGLFLNIVVVFLVLQYLDVVKKLLGSSGVYILRKLFGVILLAIAIRLITANLNDLILAIQMGQ